MSRIRDLARLALLLVQPKGKGRVLYQFALTNRSPNFVQIGSNNGTDKDPLHDFVQRFGWRGVMVEPQPDVFNRELRPLYADNPRVRLVNAAISEKSGKIELHTVAFSSERWATGLATLEADLMNDHITSGWLEKRAKSNGCEPPADKSQWIRTIEVDTMTVEQLLDTSQLTDVDVIHVDTEGADAMIVQQFPLARLTTRILLFEHLNLSDADLATTCRFLDSHGFRLYRDGMDVLALRRFRCLRISMQPMAAPWGR